jgi:cell division transport system ATP-binding protein
MEFVRVSHLYKTYPQGHHALKNVNFSISKGEFVYLTGPSGAGKSTLFNILACFDQGTEGKIQVGSFDLSNMKRNAIPFYRRRIGVIFQDYKLLETETVFENVALPLKISGEASKKIELKVNEILEQVGLAKYIHEYPLHLSGGEQQRVAVARALVHNPEFVIADEPTGSLDKEKTKEIISLLEAANARGATLLVATHDTDMVERSRHRVLKLKQGEFPL